MNRLLLTLSAVLLASPLLAAPAPKPAAAAAEPNYGFIDTAIGELNSAAAGLSECAAIADYYAAEAAKAKKRFNGPAPSHMSGLLIMKMRLADEKRRVCVAAAAGLGAHYDMVLQQLSSIEPRSAKGVLARRNALLAQRKKLNDAIAKVGGKPAAKTEEPSEE